MTRRASRTGSASASRLPRTRSRARRARAGAASRSGTASAACPGAVANGDTGDVACDHYHRYARGPRPDGASSASSATASRSPGRGSCPTGRARRTQAGLDFYRRLVEGAARARHRAARDALPLGPAAGAAGRAAAGPHRDTAGALRRVRGGRRASALGDVVERWITHNEPWVTAFLGYAFGTQGAGRARLADGAPRRRTTCCSRTASRCEALRASPARGPRSASRSTSSPCYPAERSDEDRAARRGAWTASSTAGSSTRCSAAAYPDDMVDAATRRARPARRRPRRRPASDRARRSTSSASTTTSRRASAPAATSRPLRVSAAPRRRRRPPRWAGRSTPDALHERARSACARVRRRCRLTSPRTAPRSTTRRRRNGLVDDPRAARVPPSHLDGARARDRRRRRRPRLLRLVAARQLRVGARLRQALRDRVRRLPDAAAGAEGERPLVPRLHRPRTRARRRVRRTA